MHLIKRNLQMLQANFLNSLEKREELLYYLNKNKEENPLFEKIIDNFYYEEELKQLQGEFPVSRSSFFNPD